MAFHNRVRLPVTIDKPQFGSTRSVYVKANGDTVLLSSILKKTYQGSTDWMPAKWQERLFIALNHSHVVIEGQEYVGGVALDGDAFNIDWDEIFHTPAAPAKFQVIVTPYDESNPNCITCDQAGQLEAVDDKFPDPLEEDTTYEIDVIANDNICCYPISFSIVSFNSDYLTSATIDANGTATIHLKTGLTKINGLKLFTYRVTCGDGDVFDDADVYGDVDGSVDACLAPTDLTISGVTNTTFHAAWTAPSPAPDHYRWQVLAVPGATVILEGDTAGTFIDVTSDVVANTEYTFQVRSQCDATDDDDSASNWIQENVTTTPVAENSCGFYQVFPRFGGDPAPPHQGTITYLSCGGVYQTVHADLLGPVNICALQTSDGAYISIVSTFTGMSITWLNSFECG